MPLGNFCRGPALPALSKQSIVMVSQEQEADSQTQPWQEDIKMKEIKTILCAVDLSDHSKAVAEYASMLARKLSARVVVVYTAPSLSQYVGFHVPPNTIENFVGEIVTGAEQSMEAFVAENFSGIDAKGQVLIGYAAEEILNRAREEKVDMIVMGTHGRKGIDRILFGSVAEKVVKNADMPVLTIRPRSKANG